MNDDNKTKKAHFKKYYDLFSRWRELILMRKKAKSKDEIANLEKEMDENAKELNEVAIIDTLQFGK